MIRAALFWSLLILLIFSFDVDPQKNEWENKALIKNIFEHIQEHNKTIVLEVKF